MTKLVVTADIHGSYSSWLTLTELLNPDDSLAIAGDLFDTIYGNYSHVDFQPESIKKELKNFKHKLYYVYGNCDNPSFYPGFNNFYEFSMFHKKIFMHHGFKSVTVPEDSDIIIQGHTHLCSLEKHHDTIYLNPGSIVSPRNSLYTYAEITSKGVKLLEFKTKKEIACINF